MSLGTGIFLVSLGAILTFAVRRDLFWLDIQVLGGVLMLTGVVVLVITGSLWRARRRSRTVTQDKQMQEGQPTAVTEHRVYHDPGSPPPS